MSLDPLLPDESGREPGGRSARRSRVILLLLALVAMGQASDVVHGTVAPAETTLSARGRARGRWQQAYSTPRPGARVTPAAVAVHTDAGLYDPGIVRTIFITFPRADWQDDLASKYRSDVDVPATVTIDNVVYRDVGVRFRGNSSYRMVPDGLKKSLNLAFDHVHEDQHVAGYRTLNLLNSNGDPTFVRTVLYSEIASRYIPVPRANFVRVVINGESWGIYVNLQQFNKDFLRDFYGTTKGARWKVPGSPRGRAGLEYAGDAIESYKTTYEIKSKDDPGAWQDLVRLCRLLNTTPPEDLEAVLSPHLDIDGVLKFLALEMALVNTDGYWSRASDYSIYQDERRRFHILPYDFNEAMGVQGGGRRGGTGAPSVLDPLVGLEDAARPLRSKLLAVPALQARYLRYVRDIAEHWMDWSRIGPIVERHQALIAADVRGDGRKLYGWESFAPAALQRFFESRRAFLLQQAAPQGPDRSRS